MVDISSHISCSQPQVEVAGSLSTLDTALPPPGLPNIKWLGHPNLSCTHCLTSNLAAERRHTILDANAPSHYLIR